MNAVLRQKAGAGKQVQESRAMSPARAFRLALARAGSSLGLALEVRGCDAHLAPQQSVIEAAGDMPLILRLARGDGQPGVLCVDAGLLASLLECQILGNVTDKPPPDRSPTHTDAALVLPFANGVLREVTMDADVAARMRVVGKLQRAGLLDTLLTRPTYQFFEAAVEITAERQGKAVLILPLDETAEDDTAPAASTARKDRPAPAIEAPAALHVVLCRLRRPLAEVRGLKAGDVLTLPHGVLTRARLEFDEGQAGADVELGRLNGYRAVRLAGSRPAQPPDPIAAPPEALPVVNATDEGFGVEVTPPEPTDGVA